MQGPGKGKRNFSEETGPNTRGRVVDLRTWRNRKRMEGWKRRFTNRRRNLHTSMIAVTAFAAVLAVLSYIPSAQQGHLVLLCWLVSLVCLCWSLFMHVQYDTTVRRVALANLLCMALSFIAALTMILA